MAREHWVTWVSKHPGATLEEVQGEPDWSTGHNHRIGFKNRENRLPGYTDEKGEDLEEELEVEEARRKFRLLQDKARKKESINFRDIVQGLEDFHLSHPDDRSVGWRYVLECTEDWVKYGQDWAVNVKKREKEKEEEQQGQKDQQADAKEKGESSKPGDQQQREDRPVETDAEKPHKEYTPEQVALLHSLQQEKDYILGLEVNDGTRKSPQAQSSNLIYIDQADQFTPGNWIPRSPDLIRLTGKHPLNAEPPLSVLFDAGVITPNELHYVRSHGSVPRLLWEFHEIDIEHGKFMLSMDNLKHGFSAINIPISIACDGNRRKELNMLKRSKGFSWASGAVGCAYWKGPLLRDVLLAAGITDTVADGTGGPGAKKRYWVNFEGADELSEETYATCIPFDYAMDPTNDVILAYEMNDVPLPPDHGYPVRVIIPGFVGGRCVKWLKRIWISDKENDSYYHIWDNRVVPDFVTEIDDEFADAMFHHPDTACNEQNLNSVIAKPAHGERIALSDLWKIGRYRVQGYAYDGGGHAVQRVEVSIDGGQSWRYCFRHFPEAPIRHGNKFWSWVHWHVDIGIAELLNATGITVRCFNVFKNTQPERPTWNLTGMMNNCWYTVKTKIENSQDAGESHILFAHPVAPGTGSDGWMKPSVENQIAAVRQAVGVPQRQFTREEIEKHDKDDDCWIVVDGKVYDATSVLSWHPGGMAPILAHAGRVHQETTDDFESIHDDFAREKMKECILGVVTDKAMNYIKKNAEKAAAENAASRTRNDAALRKNRWVPAKLIDRQAASRDTNSYIFKLPDDTPVLGLGTGRHLQLGFHLKDKMLIRPYTPICPILPVPDSNAKEKVEESDRDSRNPGIYDGTGKFELVIKTYFPSDTQPGGAMSNILDTIPLGEEVDIRGPNGEILYHGNGRFTIDGKELFFRRISLVLGGTGVTPGYSIIAHILLSDDDDTEIRVVDGNKTENDILLRSELERFENESSGQLKITHVLSHPDENWKGERGFATADLLRRTLFPPEKDTVALLCGPPPMIKNAVLPALKDWGYVEDENIFGF